MSRKLKVAVATLCGTVLMAGGVAYAAPKIALVRAPAVVQNTNAPSVAVQTEFVPITPCRIIDARISVGGILKANATRAFIVGGAAGFTNQGGKNGGCGIPASATAISASITATGITGTGIIHAWPDGSGEPNATVMNYNKVAGSVTTGVTLPVNPASSMGLLVKAKGANTQFVTDVLGYYREPIAAGISSSGVLGSHSSHVLSAARGSGNPTGVYTVNFDHDMTGCVVMVSPATTGYVLVTAVVNGSSATLVGRTASTGALADTPISMTVTC